MTASAVDEPSPTTPRPPSRLIYTGHPFERVPVSDQRSKTTRTPSLPFILEELLATGVGQILIPHNSAFVANLESLDPFLARNVHVIDKRNEVLPAVTSILRPVLTDLGGEFTGDMTSSALTYKLNRPQAKDLVDSFQFTFFWLQLFFHGVRENAQITQSVVGLKPALDKLRLIATSQQARAKLAFLSGSVLAYEQVTVPLPGLNATPSPEQLTRLKQLVNDEAYAELSTALRDTGFITRSRLALNRIADHARRLCDKPPFRTLVSISNAVLAIATGKDLAALQELTRSREPYMPALVSLEEPIRRAHIRWLTDTPRSATA